MTFGVLDWTCFRFPSSFFFFFGWTTISGVELDETLFVSFSFGAAADVLVDGFFLFFFFLRYITVACLIGVFRP